MRIEARRRRPHLQIACAVAGLASAPFDPLALGVVAALATLAAAFAFGSRAALGAAAIVLLAAAAGAWRLESLDAPARALPVGTAIDATAVLLEKPRQAAFASTAVMRLESGPARGLRILAQQRSRTWPADAPGTRFAIQGFVREETRARAALGPRLVGRAVTSEANAGAPGTPGFGPLPAVAGDGEDFDFAAFLRSRGIGRQVQVDRLRVVGRRGGVPGLVDRIRGRAERGISARLAADHAALARGMVLGEDGDVSAETRDDFQRAGLAHLLAASGQNVALLCALVFPLFVLTGAPVVARVAVLLPTVALYVALAGSGASVMRAGVMAVAGLLALAASRRASAVYALELAAVVTLAMNPRSPGDPGWQLSFAAVGGMLLLGPVFARPLGRLPRLLAEALGATLAATIATAPLMAYQFGAVSIAALPANLLAFPAVAPVMWLGMAAGALEQAAAAGGPVALAAHGAEAISSPLIDLALRWISAVATRFADPAWAQAQIRPGWPGVAVAYAALAALVAMAHPATPYSAKALARRAPAMAHGLDHLRALSPSRRRAFAAPVIALVLAAGAHAGARPAPPRVLTVDFIDVGQGDSTLIRDPAGAAVLFDGGVPEARVDRALKRLGVRKLSVVVATHAALDHHGGLLQVIRRFPVGLFLDGSDGTTDPSFTRLVDEVDRRRIPRRAARAGERLRVGQMTIRVLSPRPRPPGPPPADANSRAIVAVVSSNGFDLFLSADAESGALLPLDLPRVDAMKVPHHGSADPDLPQLLRRLRPRVAVIETGRGNRYGHPRPPTLDVLRRVPRVYRTDRDGTVELTADRDRLAVRTHR